MKRERPNPMGDTPMENSLFVFKVMLDNYVDGIAFRINQKPDAKERFLQDLANDPDWFDKWSNFLGMGTNLTVYGVSAMVLLKEYSKEKLDALYSKQLTAGNPQLIDKLTE